MSGRKRKFLGKENLPVPLFRDGAGAPDDEFDEQVELRRALELEMQFYAVGAAIERARDGISSDRLGRGAVELELGVQQGERGVRQVAHS